VFWARDHRLIRRVGAVSALALFLLGSQFCLVGVLKGAPMSCMATAKAGSAPTAGHCAAHAASSQDPQAPANSAPAPARAKSPCCVSLAPTHAPEIARVDVAPLPLLIALAPASLDDAPRVVLTHPPLDDDSPPPGWEKTVRAGRAPPLS
jgi:hypothetical protein